MKKRHVLKKFSGTKKDGSAWYGDDNRKVIRGGSWSSAPGCCRSTYRGRNYKDKYIGTGFRVVINT